MLRKSHISYSNMRAWKIVRQDDVLSVVPSLSPALANGWIVLPGSAFFWWLAHCKASIPDRTFLLLWDSILFGTPLFIFAIAIVVWRRTREGGLPYLKITKTIALAELPRHEIRFHAGDPKYTFVHDHFIDKKGPMDPASEFNLVANVGENEIATPLLKFLGYFKLFDQLGAELESLGFRFLQRTTYIDSEDS
jgi:hypothetical protein